MMSKKQMIMARVAMTAAAFGIDINRVIAENIEDSRYPKEDPKGSREIQEKKILDAKIKRVKKAMIKDRCSKEEIQIAIDAIKSKNNE